jgi:predicted Ser/Thr protein kinase
LLLYFLAMLALLCSAGAPAQAQGSLVPGFVNGEHDFKEVKFNTQPDGVDVVLQVASVHGKGQFLGTSDKKIRLDLKRFEGVSGFYIEYDAPGYIAKSVRVTTEWFKTHDTYPAEGADILSPTHWWVPWVGFLRRYGTVVSVVGLLAGAVVLVVVPPMVRRVSMGMKLATTLASVEDGDPILMKVLGGYRLVERLGQGGSSSVYRGVPVDNMDDRESVAVKVLRPDRTNPQSRQRMAREINICARLSHPNIVGIIDWGEQNDLVYVIMEYIPGKTLRELLPPEGMELSECVPYIRSLMSGVAYAHSKGVVHRDLKPENAVVTKTGVLKLIDFGIARVENQTTITETGRLFGTFAYLAPERLVTSDDPLSDQYSIGVMAYELLCGSRPFPADTPTVVGLQHFMREAPPLREQRPDVPEAIELVVMRMLCHEKSERYANMEAAITAWNAAAEVARV